MTDEPNLCQTTSGEAKSQNKKLKRKAHFKQVNHQRLYVSLFSIACLSMKYCCAHTQGFYTGLNLETLPAANCVSASMKQKHVKCFCFVFLHRRIATLCPGVNYQALKAKKIDKFFHRAQLHSSSHSTCLTISLCPGGIFRVIPNN